MNNDNMKKEILAKLSEPVELPDDINAGFDAAWQMPGFGFVCRYVNAVVNAKRINKLTPSRLLNVLDYMSASSTAKMLDHLSDGRFQLVLDSLNANRIANVLDFVSDKRIVRVLDHLRDECIAVAIGHMTATSAESIINRLSADRLKVVHEIITSRS